MARKTIGRYGILSVVLGAVAASGAEPVPVVNLRAAVLGDLWLSERFLAFHVRESDQGEDLNGDGDLEDWFVHVRDLQTGDAENAVVPGDVVALSGHRLIVRAIESAAGDDLNGDGDSEDLVYEVLDLETRAWRNLGLAAPPYADPAAQFVFVSPNWLGLPVDELSQGRDLNDDGDLDDVVVHAADLRDGSTRNLGRAGRIAGMTAERAILWVEESAQGEDWNDDGDLDGWVLEAVELEGGRADRLSPPGEILEVGEDWLVLGVDELFAGRDLDGDEDLEDRVVHVWSFEAGEMTNLRLAGSVARLSDDRLGLEVSESAQGEDLNGDGDTRDAIVHVSDLRSGVAENLGLSGPLLEIHGTKLLLQGGESGNSVYKVYDLAARTAVDLGLAGGGPLGRASAGRLAVQVFEDAQGEDLNGDGDLEDAVPHLVYLETSVAVNLGLAMRDVRGPVGNWLACAVSEPGQGVDANGDGDAVDYVVHVADVGHIETLPRFVRGDCDGDGRAGGGVTDAVVYLLWAYAGGPSPPCLAACDADGDGSVGRGVTDAVYLLAWAFLGGPAPPQPFPRCGASLDPDDAALGCDAAPACP